MVNITINGEGVSVPAGISILEAAKQVKINIPHLCYLEGLEEFGACRLCVVELEGEPRLTPSCVREVAEGMKIHTNTGRVRRARRTIIELLLANHNVSCPTCERNETCDLQKIAKDLGVQ
ncbi:MAG: 2Fe-2S iron-sulfur cluster-binding protein, partial [Dehalococcoidales bacterium]